MVTSSAENQRCVKSKAKGQTSCWHEVDATKGVWTWLSMWELDQRNAKLFMMSMSTSLSKAVAISPGTVLAIVSDNCRLIADQGSYIKSSATSNPSLMANTNGSKNALKSLRESRRAGEMKRTMKRSMKRSTNRIHVITQAPEIFYHADQCEG